MNVLVDAKNVMITINGDDTEKILGSHTVSEDVYMEIKNGIIYI